MALRVDIKNLSVDFPMNYDRGISVPDKVREIGRLLTGRQKQRKFRALDDVSFQAHEGDIVGILGNNGAGKTTLLRALCGIYHPDEGSVNVTGNLSIMLSLGIGFERSMSGRDNVRLNGLILGMPLEEIEEKIARIIEYADIGEHINMPISSYSTGMISRLSFAIATAMRPDILVMDEIFSVGDLSFREKSEKTIDEMMREASCQIIVSHGLSYMRERCTHVLYLKRGKVVNFGKPADVIRHYMLDCGQSSDVTDPMRVEWGEEAKAACS